MIENRRSRRRPTQQGIDVTNVLTGEPLGQVGNLSADGMLLVANHQMADGALYQVEFELPGATPPRRLAVGLYEQWSEAASTPGQFWAGFRIIDIAPDDRVALGAWVEKHDDL